MNFKLIRLFTLQEKFVYNRSKKNEKKNNFTKEKDIEINDDVRDEKGVDEDTDGDVDKENVDEDDVGKNVDEDDVDKDVDENADKDIAEDVVDENDIDDNVFLMKIMLQKNIMLVKM